MPENLNSVSKKRTKSSQGCDKFEPAENKPMLKISKSCTGGKVCVQETNVKRTSAVQDKYEITLDDKDAGSSVEAKINTKLVAKIKHRRVRDWTKFCRLERTSGIIGVTWHNQDNVWKVRSILAGVDRGTASYKHGSKSFNHRVLYPSIAAKSEEQAIDLAKHAAIRYRRFIEVVFLLKGISNSVRQRLENGLPARIVPPCITKTDEFEVFLDKHFPDLNEDGAADNSDIHMTTDSSRNESRNTILQQWREYSKKFLAGESLYDLIALDGSAKRGKRIQESFLKRRLQKHSNGEPHENHEAQPSQHTKDDIKEIVASASDSMAFGTNTDAPTLSTDLPDEFDVSKSNGAVNSLTVYQGDHSLQPEEPQQIINRKTKSKTKKSSNLDKKNDSVKLLKYKNILKLRV